MKLIPHLRTGASMDKIICLGKNYLNHAKELGDAVPEKPVLFLKPPSVSVQIQKSGDQIHVQLPNRAVVHHECEIILKLDAQKRISAVSLGLDLTLRDVQNTLKRQGHPWEISKVFASSAILGPWISISEFKDYMDTEFKLSVNGVTQQAGFGNQMMLQPRDCVPFIQDFFPICENDVIFTGTPEGVGPLKAGDLVEVTWAKKLSYHVRFSG
jgi:2-keto-4-pentenoate hydratase/2-oxohepta-3-ene-1,7-dioic acid hydratase in catechol pathway